MPNNGTALCDTGVLVALFSAGQARRDECETALTTFQGNLVTTVAVLAETFHFVGPQVERERIWGLLSGGGMEVVELSQPDLRRVRSLMRIYADLPMDFADASLVAIGERLRINNVFTLDAHFRVFRPRHTTSFDILP